MKFTTNHVLVKTCNCAEILQPASSDTKYGQIEYVSLDGLYIKLRMANRKVKKLVTVKLADVRIIPFATIY